MNPIRSRPGRSLERFVTRYRKRRSQFHDIRLIEQLPERFRRDIGWPPFGDLDERCGS